MLFWCLISCLEAKGDSSVISIRVGKRDRVLRNEVAFGIVFGKIMFFDFLIFGGGVNSNLYVMHSYSYDSLVCAFLRCYASGP